MVSWYMILILISFHWSIWFLELTKDSREAEHAGLGGFGHGGHEAHGGHRELGELRELGGPAEDDSDVCNHVIQHLHEEIEKREINLRSNQSIISSIQVVINNIQYTGSNQKYPVYQSNIFINQLIHQTCVLMN